MSQRGMVSYIPQPHEPVTGSLNFQIKGNMNHLKSKDPSLPLNMQHHAVANKNHHQEQHKPVIKQNPNEIFKRLVDEQNAKGSNLMDQYAEQLDLEKQVIQLGYENPKDAIFK